MKPSTCLYETMLTDIVFVESCQQSHFFIFLNGRYHLLMLGTNEKSYIFLIEITFVNSHTQKWFNIFRVVTLT